MDENTESVYWNMLIALESKTNPNKDIIDKNLVEAAYRHWNTMHTKNIPLFPKWMRNDEEVGHRKNRR